MKQSDIFEKKIGENDGKIMLSRKETLRQRNESMLQMQDSNKERMLQNKDNVSKHNRKKPTEIYCPDCRVPTGGVRCWVYGLDPEDG